MFQNIQAGCAARPGRGATDTTGPRTTTCFPSKNILILMFEKPYVIKESKIYTV